MGMIQLLDLGSDVASSTITALESGELVGEQEAATVGTYVFKFERQGFLGNPHNQVLDELEAWMESVAADPGFKGTVGPLYFRRTLYPDPFYEIWVPVKLEAGDIPVGPELASSFAVVTIAIWLGILVATAIIASSVAITVAPDAVRKVTATAALAIHPNSETLQELASGDIKSPFEAIPVALISAIAIAYLVSK
jgi:hypothetical protein